MFRTILAVFLKDCRSELKTRYALNAILMFVLTAVATVAFSSAGERITNGIAASMLWIVLFFSAMTGLQKSFVSEEERGTSLMLRLHASSTAIYFGKLLFNMALTLLLYGLATITFFIFVNDVTIRSPLLFWTSFVLGSLATASATTIIAAIIAKANTKAALFPVLAFPALLPLILTGVETTYQALAGVAFAEARNNFQIVAAYTVVVVAVSFMLFDFVWND
jgi:heme exporter protein B